MPDVSKRTRSLEDSFLMIACDGIWDVLTSAETKEYIGQKIDEHKEDGPVEHILESFFDEILCEDPEDQNDTVGCSDNMSAILIQFSKGS